MRVVDYTNYVLVIAAKEGKLINRYMYICTHNCCFCCSPFQLSAAAPQLPRPLAVDDLVVIHGAPHDGCQGVIVGLCHPDDCACRVRVGSSGLFCIKHARLQALCASSSLLSSPLLSTWGVVTTRRPSSSLLFSPLLSTGGVIPPRRPEA